MKYIHQIHPGIFMQMVLKKDKQRGKTKTVKQRICKGMADSK
jgi:uncharacterized protein YwbE